MLKIKQIIIAVLFTFVLTSCGEFTKVLNKGTSQEQYMLATKLYEEEKHNKAIQLFEKVIPAYRGKPQMERIQYMTADSYYKTEDYSLSSYYFSKFIVNYPESSKVEEAAFLGAKSYYLASPKYSLDQQDTQKALVAFQSYIDTYPNSELISEANVIYKDLVTRLEKKDFEVAKQYYHIEKYNAAITAFDSFNEEHLGSVFKEDALFYKLKATYDLGMKSVLTKKEQRLLDAKYAYNKFKKAFPDSKKMKEANNMLKQIDKELVIIKEEFSTISQNN